MDTSDVDNGQDKRLKNKPSGGKFKQQELPAWKPILTPQRVLPVVFIIGVAFLAIGVALLLASNSVNEIVVDYTDCVQKWNNASSGDKDVSCADLLEDPSKGYTNHTVDERCECHVPVTLGDDFENHETFLYYALEEFYQNHRQYVSSRYDPQLRAVTVRGSSECKPFYETDNGTYYAPCGLVANSLFNDTIELFRCTGDNCSPTSNSVKISLSGRHITWASDRDKKFRNPSEPESATDLCQKTAFLETTKPPNWPVGACLLGRDVASVTSPDQIVPFYAWHPFFGSTGEGYENEDLIVWMRNAALPDFRKLYRKITEGDLVSGQYVMRIFYNYPVKNFDGKKKVVLSTTSWIGGKNPFLGITYLVVGGLCVLVNVVFVIAMRVKKRELGSDKYLVWDK